MDSNPLSATLRAATGGLRAQSERLRLISENISNVDTPGYRRKLVTFEQTLRSGASEGPHTGPVRLDPKDPEKLFQPGHPLANAEGYVDGSNVDLVIEIADAREAQRSYEANLRLFEQAREMSRNLFDLLKR